MGISDAVEAMVHGLVQRAQREVAGHGYRHARHAVDLCRDVHGGSAHLTALKEVTKMICIILTVDLRKVQSGSTKMPWPEIGHMLSVLMKQVLHALAVLCHARA